MQFHALVRGFWGAKASVVSFSPSTIVFTCVLYDSFDFRCGLDGEHHTFTGGIQTASGQHITQFLGRRFLRNSDAASILANLQLADDYCRLRLPDKFLDAFDNQGSAGTGRSRGGSRT